MSRPSAAPVIETGAKIAKIIPIRPADEPNTRPDRLALAIGAVTATAILFPMSDMAAKHLMQHLPGVEVAWLRYVMFCVAVLPLVGVGGRRAFRTARPLLQCVRGAGSSISTLLAIVAFAFIPVGETTAIGFIAPVFVTAMAAMFLRERVSWKQWAAAAAGFVGILIIVRPQPSGFNGAALLPLVAALFSAVSTIATRMMKYERSSTTMIYSALIGTVIISVPLAFQWVTPAWRDLPYIAICGGFAVLANLTQIVSYGNGPASTVAPFGYMQIVWASVMGYLVFGNVPDIGLFIGAAVIAASGIYTGFLAHATMRRRKRPAAEPVRAEHRKGPLVAAC